MKIGELGEFKLIERIQGSLPAPGGEVIVGIGDDVAVLRGSADRVWLATCDVQVEGSHFLRAAIDPCELGHKALAINLSDVASAGGTPRMALVSLGLPADLEVEFVDRLYVGLREEAAEFGVDIVGGNISSSKLGLFIDIFLLGQAPPENVVLRSDAQVGDAILATGSLGDAAAGVALVLQPTLATTLGYQAVARDRYNRPTPRVREGELIGASHQAHAMVDVSDGLASDLGHICERSQVSARVYASQLPVSPANRALAREAHGDEWYFALHGGEDYELVLTAGAPEAPALAEEIHRATGTRVSIIGEILPPDRPLELVLQDGRVIPLEAHGWDHLKH